MYETILLALDGSPFSERAVPHATELARRFDARLLLLRVAVPIVGPDDLAYGAIPYTYEHILETEQRRAEEYVAAKAAELSALGVKAEGICRTGDAAATIVDLAVEREAGIIVIATHGRTGVARWVFGSVAIRVLQSSPVPLFLVRAVGP